MPNVPTYIKSDDLGKYLAIHAEGNGAWAEFIHNALNRNLQEVHNEWDKLEDAGLYKPIKTPTVMPQAIIKTPKDAFTAVKIKGIAAGAANQSRGLCKIHGTPLDGRGKCLQKGCKYA